MAVIKHHSGIPSSWEPIKISTPLGPCQVFVTWLLGDYAYSVAVIFLGTGKKWEKQVGVELMQDLVQLNPTPIHLAYALYDLVIPKQHIDHSTMVAVGGPKLGEFLQCKGDQVKYAEKGAASLTPHLSSETTAPNAFVHVYRKVEIYCNGATRWVLVHDSVSDPNSLDLFLDVCREFPEVLDHPYYKGFIDGLL